MINEKTEKEIDQFIRKQEEKDNPWWIFFLIPGNLLSKLTGIFLLTIHDAICGPRGVANEFFLAWFVGMGYLFAIMFWVCLIGLGIWWIAPLI